MKLADLVPKGDERGVIVGMSGSGKSYLATELLKHCVNVVILDPKRMFKFPNLTVAEDAKTFVQCLKANRFPLAYRPKPKDLTNVKAYNEVLEAVYNRGNLTLYVDDLVGVMEGTRFPHYLQVIYQMGRAKNIRTLSAIQRPAKIPLFTISEATRLYIFKLNIAADMKRIREMTHGYEPEKQTVKHSFFYYDVNSAYTQAQQMKLPG